MVVFQNFTNPNHVLEALTSSVGPETSEYRIAVAYVTREGARTVIAALEEEIGPGWKEIPKSLITCFDFGHTEPSALRFLWDQGFELRIANLRGDGCPIYTGALWRVGGQRVSRGLGEAIAPGNAILMGDSTRSFPSLLCVRSLPPEMDQTHGYCLIRGCVPELHEPESCS